MDEQEPHADKEGAFHDYAADFAEATSAELSQDTKTSSSDRYSLLPPEVRAAYETGDADQLTRAIQTGLMTAINIDSETGIFAAKNKALLEQQLVASGLVAELAEAYATLTDPGVPGSQPGRRIHQSQRSRRFIELAAGVPYDEAGHPKDGKTHVLATDHNDLLATDWVALASLQEPGIEQQKYLQRSLDALRVRRASRPQNSYGVEEYVGIAETITPGLVPNILTLAREARQINGFSSDPLVDQADAAILQFIHNGREDLATALLTPSGNEPERIARAQDTLQMSTEERDATVQRAVALYQEKVKQFREAMTDRGIPEDIFDLIIDSILSHTNDPETALEVSPDFWQTLDALPYAVEDSFYNTKGSLGRASECIQALAQNGLLAQSPRVLPEMMIFEDSTSREAYAASLSEAISAEESAGRSWSGGFAGFNDPAAARELALRLFPPEDLSSASQATMTLLDDHLHKAYGHLPYSDGLVVLNPEHSSFLERAKELLVKGGLSDDGALEHIGKLAINSEDGPENSAKLLDALSMFEGRQDAAEGLALMLAAKNPAEAAKTWATYSREVSTLPESAQADLKKVFSESLEPMEHAQAYFGLVTELAAHNVALGQDNSSSFRDLFKNTLRAPGERQRLIENFVDRDVISRETRARLSPYFHEIVAEAKAKTDDDTEEVKPPDPSTPIEAVDPFEAYPETKAIFRRLGIPEPVAKVMYDTWRSYDSLGKVARDQEDRDFKPKKLKDFTPGDIEAVLTTRINRVNQQLLAAKEYIRAYGIEELLEVHDTFETVNFIRSRPERMHDQLMRWQDPNEIIKVLSASAYRDPNGAFDTAANDAFGRFGEPGTFCFEANGKVGIAKMAVKAGKRERSMGRDPEIDSQLEIVEINAHGSPSTLALGVKFDTHGDLLTQDGWDVEDNLDLEAYAQAAQNRTKVKAFANTYKKHLGSGYRVILSACSTAGDVILKASEQVDPGDQGLKNIAETLSDAHGRPVFASPKDIYSYSIAPDGAIAFVTSRDGRELTPARIYESETV